MAKKSKKIHQPGVVATQGATCDEVYQAIFALSPDAIAVHDGVILQLINPAGVKMLGAASADEVIGKSILELVHPENHSVIHARFELQLQGQDVPTLTTKLIRVDGSTLDVEINSSRYHYQGAPASLIFIRDITERKRTEDALRESEAGLRKAQHYAQMGSWALNMQTGQLSWSDEMYAIYGIDKATFTGVLNDVIEQSVHPDDRAKVNEIRRMTIEQGNFWPMEQRIIWADGSIHIIRAEPAEIICDETGAVLFLRGTSQEITERKRAEMLLKQSEHRLHQAAQLARLGIWEWNVPTDKLEVNDILLQIYGISAEDFAGKGAGYIAYTRADYRKTQLDYIANAFEQGITEADFMAGKIPTAKPLEICIVRPDGSECYVLGSAVGMTDEHGKRLRMLGTLQDITERKETEERLRESEERFRSLSDASFEGIMIHDESIIQDANQVFANLFGYEKPEDFIGKNGFDLIPFTPESLRS